MTSEAEKGAKILLVDALEENRLALSALLSPEASVLTAASGQQALELLLEHEVALALIDVQMPDMDGVELAELMRGTQRTHQIPIIFVTACGFETARLFRGYDAGAVDFLFEPIDPYVLRHKVRTFIQLYQQRIELAEQVAVLERQEAETRLLKEELMHTLRLNELFVASVSHDLRAPLNVVLMTTELLLTNSRSDEDRRAIDRAHSSARRMSSMIDQLYDLARARLDDGIPLAVQDHVDLAIIVRELVAEVTVAHTDRRIEISVAGDTRGRWDYGRLSRVVSNLVGNSVRHGSPRDPIRIAIDGTTPELVRLSVANHGQIAEELLPNLFAPFHNKNAGPPQSDGLGLGLYIVSEIVTAHGGRVEVTTGSDQTRFVITLPRRASSKPRTVTSQRKVSG